MEIIIQALLLVVGFLMLMKGADWFVEGASRAARRFGIPQLVVGLTIVAMGTSAPEAAVSISAALKGSAEITVGNVVGSNILNVLVILGATAIIRRITVQKSTIKYELPFLIGISGMMLGFGWTGHQITRLEGVIFWIFMLLYLYYLLRMAQAGHAAATEEAGEKEPLPKLLLLIVTGVGFIIWGSDLTVDSATELARIFGMSERLIGLTIIAFGTSLPELVTSVTAAVKGNSEIAVGNIVGSNIFNILFVTGTTALITPVVYGSNFFVDSIIMVFSVILLFGCVIQKKSMGKKGGGLLLAAYGLYLIYIL